MAEYAYGKLYFKDGRTGLIDGDKIIKIYANYWKFKYNCAVYDAAIDRDGQWKFAKLVTDAELYHGPDLSKEMEMVVFIRPNGKEEPVLNKTEGKPKETVNHPSHYNQNGLETIDVIKAFCEDLNGVEGFDIGNCLKYLTRWKNKNGIEDLKKAKWYLEHVINYEEEKVK